MFSTDDHRQATLLFSSEDDSEPEDTFLPKRRKVIRPRINFENLSDFSFKEKFRLRKSEFEFVLEAIGEDLNHRTLTNRALTPEKQLLTALHDSVCSRSSLRLDSKEFSIQHSFIPRLVLNSSLNCFFV